MPDTAIVCLIGSDNTMLDGNYTGDRDVLPDGTRLVEAPITPDEYTWDKPAGGWKWNKPATALQVLMAGMVAAGSITSEAAQTVLLAAGQDSS